MSNIQNKFLVFLIVLCYVPVLFLGLFDVDEGAFATTSLQMIKQKQYLIPLIGDELRLEKPILTYWIQVVSMYVFGVNEFALVCKCMCPTFGYFLVSNSCKKLLKNGLANGSPVPVIYNRYASLIISSIVIL